MATAQEDGGGVLSSIADSAREFAEERLRDADTAMSPAALADEYGCSSGHMRNVLRRMREDGVVSRPAKGQYQCPPGEDADVETDGAAGGDVETDDGAAASTDADEPAEGVDPSADGGPQSEDPDTEGPSDRDAAIAGAATAGAAAVPSALEKMDTRQFVLLLAVVVAAYMVFVRDGSDSSSEAAPSTGADREEARTGGVRDDEFSVMG